MIVSNIMLERQDLIRTLNERKDDRILAVCAPAGYGKTVAITQWLNKDTRAKAIFSLDEYDNNIASFCERFCTALLSCQPHNHTLSEIVFHPSFRNAPNEFAIRAVCALSNRKQTVLVVDDLHLIHNNEVLQLFLIFFKRLPSKFQIVLISRHDLPIAFSEFWLKGYVACIGAEHFLFSVDEIKALYKKRGSQITQEQARRINQQILGWAMGINAFLLSGGESFDVAYEYLSDFIEINIWEKWDDITRDFMLRTATLRELTPALCEAMTGVAHSGKFLKALVQKGAFTTQLQNGSYRYHDLFQLFLKRKADEQGKELLISLWEIEGNWHLSQKDFYSAVDCFIRCKNHEGIAECFDLLEASGHIDFILKRLITIMKHPEIQNAAKKYPHILYPMAWCAFAEGRVDRLFSFIDEYYARHDEIVARYKGSAHKTLYMLMFDFRLPLSQMTDKMGMLSATPNLSIIRWTLAVRVPLPHRGIRDFSKLTLGNVVENAMTMGSKTGWMFGDAGFMLTSSILAGLLFEQGHLEEAYKYAINAVSEIKSRFLTEANFCSLSITVCVLDALEDSSGAERILTSISALIEKDKAYHLGYNYDAFLVRRKLVSGDVKAAKDWVEAQTSDELTLWGIYAAITTARAYIVIEDYDAALILLKKILGMVNAFNRTLDIIEVQILLAVTYWKKKRRFQNEALENLEIACRTAYPYNYVQMFVNESAELTSMLYKLQKRVEQHNSEDKKHLSFIKILYQQTDSVSNVRLEKTKQERTINFTDKQILAMNLLCQGKTQKEIADMMNIKLTTLRYHLTSICSKLDAANVSDAVKKIRAMRLLEIFAQN